MNQIRIDDIHLENRTRVVYAYSVEGEWANCFTIQRTAFIEYDADISDVPVSVLAVPFICNIIPAVWVCNAKFEAGVVDSDFLEHLEEIRDGYRKMYPSIEFGGELSTVPVQNSKNDCGGSASLFSGGVDAYTTLLRHLEEKPALITICGSDIKLDDAEGWDEASSHIKKTAEQYGLESHQIKSDFRNVLIEYQLDKHITSSGDNWWHGFQHGIAVIAHAAPLAYVFGWDTVYIASSFSQDAKGHYTCASDPSIDDHLHYCGCNTVHDGFELHRQQKVEYLVKQCNKTEIPIHLRVCWESEGGKNCCMCEKCCRTILSLIAEGADPNDYGFVWNHDLAEKCRHNMYTRFTIIEYLYYPIQKRFIENKDRIKNIEDYQWFIDLNIDSVNSLPAKRFRRSKAGRFINKVNCKLKRNT